MKIRTLFLSILAFAAIEGNAQKYVGGDISLLTKYEEAGVIYKDKSGNTVSDVLAFFKQEGLNSMRVRLFVDPSKASATHQKEGVVQDLDYVIALGKRIKSAGLSFMLDFHYSDTWTDPGKHSTPSAWNGMTVEQITQRVYDYTKECLNKLNEAGAIPDFIQPGNEITYGMLWPTGHIYPAGGGQDGGTWDNFTGYLASAIKACKESCPSAQIVIQTEMSKAANVTNFYKTLKGYANISYDILGLSYYPDYHGSMANFENVINSLEKDYPDKKIMVVETGYSYAWHIGNTYNLESTYPLTEEGQRKFTADLITMLNNHSSVNGLYWWWPEDNGNKSVTTSWWNAALYNHNTGQPWAAFYELKNFLSEDASVYGISTDGEINGNIYDLSGRHITEMQKPGIYIKNKRKILK